MPVVLLVLGVVVTAAGLLLTAHGVTIHDGTVDSEVVTPGVIAAVGGLLLVGLGLLVRVLQHIERALAARPAAGAARLGEASAIGATTEAAEAAFRNPFPPKPKSNPQPASVGASPIPATTEDAAFERLRVKFPNLSRVENAAVGEAAEVASMPQPTRAGEESGEERNTATIGRGRNGASPARVAPRFELKARAAASPDNKAKGSVFKPFAGARREPDVAQPQAAPVHAATAHAAPAQAASAQPAPPTAAASPPAPAADTVPEASAAAEDPAALSVLKSGVVEGMAYTLYSDGSIEAQLPQGTLRFGSITALRSHIENAS
jgi:hypothetical protein